MLILSDYLVKSVRMAPVEVKGLLFQGPSNVRRINDNVRDGTALGYDMGFSGGGRVYVGIGSETGGMNVSIGGMGAVRCVVEGEPTEQRELAGIRGIVGLETPGPGAWLKARYVSESTPSEKIK